MYIYKKCLYVAQTVKDFDLKGVHLFSVLRFLLHVGMPQCILNKDFSTKKSVCKTCLRPYWYGFLSILNIKKCELTFISNAHFSIHVFNSCRTFSFFSYPLGGAVYYIYRSRYILQKLWTGENLNYQMYLCVKEKKKKKQV